VSEVRDCPNCGHDARRTAAGYWYCSTCHQPYGMVLEGTGRRRARADGGDEILAADVQVADSLLAQTLGCWFRRLDEGSALVFPFDEAAERRIDMIGVPAPLDVVWCVDGVVLWTETLSAWWGAATGPADCVIELPAGTAGGLESGDELVIGEEIVVGERDRDGSDDSGRPATSSRVQE
jgi:hypothetical protein